MDLFGAPHLLAVHWAALIRSYLLAAAAVLAQQRPGWRNAKYALDWPRSLRAYAFPRIGALPVSALTTADVLSITGRTRASATVGWQRRSWISNHACVR